MGSVSKIIFILLFISSQNLYALEFQNVNEETKNKIISALEIISKIRGTNASPAHLKIFGKVDGRDYLDFFTSRVKIIKYDPVDDDFAAHFAWLKGEGAILIQKGLFEPYNPKFGIKIDVNSPDFQTLDLISVLFHEARHLEKRNGTWLHTYCPSRGPTGEILESGISGWLLNGIKACDGNPFGAYGAIAIMLRNIGMYCSNCTASFKQMALDLSEIEMKRVVGPGSYHYIAEDK